MQTPLRLGRRVAASSKLCIGVSSAQHSAHSPVGRQGFHGNFPKVTDHIPVFRNAILSPVAA